MADGNWKEGDTVYRGTRQAKVLAVHGQWVWVTYTAPTRAADGPLTFRADHITNKPVQD